MTDMEATACFFRQLKISYYFLIFRSIIDTGIMIFLRYRSKIQTSAMKLTFIFAMSSNQSIEHSDFFHGFFHILAMLYTLAIIREDHVFFRNLFKIDKFTNTLLSFGYGRYWNNLNCCICI